MASFFERSPRLPAIRTFLAWAAWALVQATLTPGRTCLAEEIGPLRLESAGSIDRGPRGRFSDRTIALAIEIDRDAARLVGFTLKNYPFVRPLATPEPVSIGASKAPRIEVRLLGPHGKTFTRRLDFPGLCLLHSSDVPPHGSAEQPIFHHDSFVIELPELVGFDRVEVAYYGKNPGDYRRNLIASEKLDSSRMIGSGGTFRYGDLAFAESGPGAAAPQPAPPIRGIYWPEDFGETQTYRIDGNASELNKRFNIVVLGDGYRHADKGQLDADFDRLTLLLRNTPPWHEHQNLLNFILVYAYSLENGTDECDCGVARDTAFGTGAVAYTTCPMGVEICYGPIACDSKREANLAVAEMRAPAFDFSMGDRTVIMVNTPRFGGCGPYSRSVFSMGNAAWDYLATHESSHTLALLADEGHGNDACIDPAQVSEINTSTNYVVGAWPEWIDELGPPLEGGQYYNTCITHPQLMCLMGAHDDLHLCPVCRQHWALVIYGNPRVSPTAPIDTMSPASPLSSETGVWTDFGIVPRLAFGLDVTNEITWRIQGPGYPTPTMVGFGPWTLARAFDFPGDYTLTVSVVADANIIKPVKYGANVDTATWSISVAQGPPPSEVSPPGSLQPLKFMDPITLVWEPPELSRSTSFDLYRGDAASLTVEGYGTCLQSRLPDRTWTDASVPIVGQTWFYLVTGKTGNSEGPMGFDSSGNPRANASPCQ